MATEKCTSDELKKMVSKTDWDRVDAMTDGEITRAALSDPDNKPVTKGQISRMHPAGVRGRQKTPLKIPVSIRLSPEVVGHFKARGRGWQGLIDTILKEYVKSTC